MTSVARRCAIGRGLAAAGILLAVLLVALWPRLSLPGRLIVGLSGFAAYGGFLAGTLRPCSGWFAPVTRRFATAEKEVWLTLDDGPDPSLTPQTLAVLGKHNARATFFVIGRRAARYPDLLRAIARAGHGLANHTYSHPSRSFWCRSRRWLARDLDLCTRAVEAATDERPRLFRPPVGMVSPAVGAVTEAHSLRVIGWSVRGRDSGFGSPEEIARRVLRKVVPGAIILLHPERRPQSLAALDLVLDGLCERGYRCVIPEPGRFAETQIDNC